MKYLLAALWNGAPPGVEISESHFDEIKLSKERLLVTLSIEEKFDILLENYAEYERELLTLTLYKMLHLDFKWTACMDDIQVLNRRLGNFLAAARLYIDQVRHDLATLSEGPGFWMKLLRPSVQSMIRHSGTE